MRLHKLIPEYQGRVRLRVRSFPLEIYGGGPPDRHELELEMWLAALQEPEAVFKPFKDAWPTTTLPAFEAAWCAFQLGADVGFDIDLRIRKAFFAEGRDIGQRGVMLDLAKEADIDLDQFNYLFGSGEPRQKVIEEGRMGKEVYQVRGTPTIMLASGKKLRHPIAYPKIEDGRIQSVGRLPCCKEGCYEATKAMFEQTINQ